MAVCLWRLKVDIFVWFNFGDKSTNTELAKKIKVEEKLAETKNVHLYSKFITHQNDDILA